MAYHEDNITKPWQPVWTGVEEVMIGNKTYIPDDGNIYYVRTLGNGHFWYSLETSTGRTVEGTSEQIKRIEHSK